MNAQPEPGATDTLALDLLRENQKLRKINKVLMERVERSTDAQGNAFSLFQAAITLEQTVRQRTAELRLLNQQLRHEISEREEVEEALKVAKLAAEHANLGKTKFLAAASHDLLQPLNAARLFLDALAELEDDSDCLRILSRIDTALESAEALLTTLLDISKLDAGVLIPDPSNFPVGVLLQRLSNEYALQAEERSLRFRVVHSNEIVRTDFRLLERVLRNLVSNALRYTSRGGVLLGCRRRGERLRIEVWDTGCGIPESRLFEVFEEFRRLETPEAGAGGMGLGLAIVDRIARLLGLRVHARSQEGRGSVFAVDVPFGDVAHFTHSDAATGGQASANPLVGKTVLLVEDDRYALEGMALLLRTWGCRTIETRSVAAAIDAVAAMEKRPDAILADYHLESKRTGLRAIELVRERFGASIPAVVITADHTEETKARVMQHNCWFLGKPVRVDRLRSLMGHLFA